jgi:hypothetical protein
MSCVQVKVQVQQCDITVGVSVCESGENLFRAPLLIDYFAK